MSAENVAEVIFLRNTEPFFYFSSELRRLQLRPARVASVNRPGTSGWLKRRCRVGGGRGGGTTEAESSGAILKVTDEQNWAQPSVGRSCGAADRCQLRISAAALQTPSCRPTRTHKLTEEQHFAPPPPPTPLPASASFPCFVGVGFAAMLIYRRARCNCPRLLRSGFLQFNRHRRREDSALLLSFICYVQT